MVAETPDWAGVTGVPYIARIASGPRNPRNRCGGSDVPTKCRNSGASPSVSVVGLLRSTTAPRGREGIPMIITADAPRVLFRRF
jgi:hypothetical protein